MTMQSQVRRVALALLLISSAGWGGCAVSDRAALARGNQSQNIIFNPEWTGIPPDSIGRSAWPSTLSTTQPSEETLYRETIIDRQGGQGARSDYRIRHFNSVRTGRSRR